MLVLIIPQYQIKNVVIAVNDHDTTPVFNSTIYSHNYQFFKEDILFQTTPAYSLIITVNEIETLDKPRCSAN